MAGVEDAGVLDTAEMLRRLVNSVEQVPSASCFCKPYKKQFRCLSRQIKLFAPMLDEVWEKRASIPEDALKTLAPLAAAIGFAWELLRFGNEGSKLYMVLERYRIIERLMNVTARLEHALDIVSFNKLGLTHFVTEQVDLVHGQFKRAKCHTVDSDLGLYNDLRSIYNSMPDTDPDIINRVVENLQLLNISEFTQESAALHELVVSNGGAVPEKNLERMSMLLKKLKDYVLTQNYEAENPPCHSIPVSTISIPDDFRCAISLELMKDPVIVSTGQTYERRSIKKWIEDGHDTCPKTRLRLANRSLIPNIVLRSLISHWSETNGLPKYPYVSSKPASFCLSKEHEYVADLILKLSSHCLEKQRSAAAELRRLTKGSSINRRCVAAAGAVPLLVTLLSKSDLSTQVHAVTALLNISILEENRELIVSSGAVPGIVCLLKNGNMEARRNAAATLFILSSVNENRILIGCESDAIQGLISLLREGGLEEKKDAASAIFTLCSYRGNKSKAVRAGVVPILVDLLMNPEALMTGIPLAMLSSFSSHRDGNAAICEVLPIPLLVKHIKSGSPQNCTNAVAILLELCVGKQRQICLAKVHECGVMPALQNLAVSGTDRAKRKAAELIECLNRFMDQQIQALCQIRV
ncbi:Protein spotted leaf 11 [Platanthera guangdongensis]|uniref:RING-type E3 ubiquitin transferase n=1 Tax=Platanthera guangdongensis TaxID=2320717 RepID=A0ABR2LVI6_9ASPA